MPWKPVVLPSQEEIDAFAREYKRRARFLVDESLGVGVALVLRQAGWNVRYVDDVGLAGHSDEDVFAFAHRDDRIILTHDTGFLDDRRFPPHRNSGIVVLPGGSGDERALLAALGQALSLLGGFRELYRESKLTIAADGTFTIRSRHLQSGAMVDTRYRFARDGTLETWENATT
jgi:predicted nuclease of predicted toxin-antitoxin system